MSYEITRLEWGNYLSPTNEPSSKTGLTPSTYEATVSTNISLTFLQIWKHKNQSQSIEITFQKINTFQNLELFQLKWLKINPLTTGNPRWCTQHCSYWCPGAKAPGHQYPQCWLNIYCIGPVSPQKYQLYETISENNIKFWKRLPRCLRVKNTCNSLPSAETWRAAAECLALSVALDRSTVDGETYGKRLWAHFNIKVPYYHRNPSFGIWCV